MKTIPSAQYIEIGRAMRNEISLEDTLKILHELHMVDASLTQSSDYVAGFLDGLQTAAALAMFQAKTS